VSLLPYPGYLVVTEAGARHATLGKRRVGLWVRDRTASSPRLSQVLLRNIVKVLPWQFGHLAASRFATGGDQSKGTVWFTLSMLLLVAVAGPPLLARPGLHDMLARTRVRDRRREGVAAR
jgi:uncharacterized RDD family membrane protein YckC